MKNFPRQLAHASGASLVLDDNRLLLAFQQAVPKAEVEKFVKELDLALEDGDLEKPLPGERVNHTDRRYWVRSARPIDDARYQRITEAGARVGLAWIGPVYRASNERGRRGLLSPLPNTLLVKLSERFQRDVDTADTANRIAAAAVKNGSTPALLENAQKSRYLNGFRYFIITNPAETNAYQLRQQLLEANNRIVADVQFETMPLITPTAVVPNDTLVAQQWDMTQINAAGAGTTGWDINTGAATVVICVLDEGCDLTHPDLQYSDPGINLGTMMPDGSPTGNHGTACAGIAAATFNNAVGVSGVAGNSLVLPVAFQSWTDAEVAAGINWATANGAHVISMSFGWNAWSPAVIDPAIQNAFNNNVVMCVATHNHNAAITYPATNPLVMAVGASDQIDNRKTPLSPDGEGWGSNFGPQISVVAPGVLIPTTDRQGSVGYNTSAGTAGDYTLTFNGTSSATPHVAGLAALLRSAYPTLTNVQIRNLIEQTSEKVGAVAYADAAGYSNGTWNQEMGYGRINVFRALDGADVMIKDAPADSGTEPFTGGNFWDFSDIVVRITDDGVFNPSNPTQSKNVERGQANYIYVQVTNRGAREARNVTVGTRITPFVGLQFVYPQDWTLVDAMHVDPTPITATFANVPSGGTVLAKFRIEAAQTETLYGWVSGSSWHPCLLAVVNADNDYSFATAPLTGDPISARRNNLAQRNLSVIDVLSGASARFPFIAGNFFNAERSMSIVIDRSRLPKNMPLLLSLDDDGSAFPAVDFGARPGVDGKDDPDGKDNDDSCGGMVFLERTRIKTKLGCYTGVLTLEKGSRLECPTSKKLGRVTVQGGEVILRGEKRYVEVKDAIVKVKVEKSPNAIFPLSLQTTIPANAAKEDQFLIQVAQQNEQGVTVGGAAMVYNVK